MTATRQGADLDAIARTKLSDSIVDRILVAIRAGSFSAGAALPAERVLAQQLGVSRGSLREAVRALEFAGVLQARQGSGTYVSSATVSPAAALRARAAIMGDRSPLDLVIARKALDPACAEHAAVQRTGDDLADLARLLAEQEARVHRGEDTADLDRAFHAGIASAAHNPVLVHLYSEVEALMQQETWLELRTSSRETAGTPRLYLRQHQAVLRGIQSSDAAAARRAARTHLAAVERRLALVVEGLDGAPWEVTTE